MTLIIGFGNKARHGKDTAAAAITDYYSGPNQSVSVLTYKYATALYAEVNEVLGKFGLQGTLDWIHSYSEGFVDQNDWVVADPNPEVSELAPYGKHPKLLQWWGTEYRRKQDPDYWVKQTLADIDKDAADIALITDVRFPNEGDPIEVRGGATVNVQRINADGTVYVDPSRPATHVSETAMDGYNWGYYIKSKSAEYTRSAAVNLVKFLKGRK